MANTFMYNSQECIIETFVDFRKSIVRDRILLFTSKL